MRVIIGRDPAPEPGHDRGRRRTRPHAGGGQIRHRQGRPRTDARRRSRVARPVWAVQGGNGIGRHITPRLVHDGQTVLDVPARLSAPVRVFATGNGRNSEPVDAHSVAMVALRPPSLVRVQVDPDLAVRGMLADRRDELGRARTQTINRLHRLLPELLAGGAKTFLSAAQARALIATGKPRDVLGRTRRRRAVELIGDLDGIDKKLKAADNDLNALVLARGGTLMDLHGVGPSRAARLLAEVGDIRRFADRDRFASCNGTAPLEACSGRPHRHRLSRNATGSLAPATAINRAVPLMAVVQLRHRTAGRAYFAAQKAAGKTSMEALRALKRRLSNVIYAGMVADQKRRRAAGPGGHSGTTVPSSVTDLTPDIGPSDKPLPGPATRHPKPSLQAAS
jgi:transposase